MLLICRYSGNPAGLVKRAAATTQRGPVAQCDAPRTSAHPQQRSKHAGGNEYYHDTGELYTEMDM